MLLEKEQPQIVFNYSGGIVERSNGTISVTGRSGFGMVGSTSLTLNQWGEPERIDVYEIGDSIEMIYVEESKIAPTTLSFPFKVSGSTKRVFKIVYSCVDGKWNKSERIYGNIIPAQKEYYEFD